MGNSCAGPQEKKVAQETLDFIVAKTNASKEDVEEQYNNFLAEYPDGKINKKGFSAMMKKCFPDQDIDKLESHIFRMYDINKDDKVDFHEFMIVLTVMGSGTVQENLEQIYRIFDINNDGHISKKELERIVKDLFGLMKPSDNPTMATDKVLAEMAFKEMDKDSDSKISKEEFINACQSHEKISSMLTLKLVDIFV